MAFFMSKTGKGRLFSFSGTYIYLFIPFNIIMLSIQSSHNRLFKARMAIAFYDPFRGKTWDKKKKCVTLGLVGEVATTMRLSLFFYSFSLFLTWYLGSFCTLLPLDFSCLLMSELRFSHSTHPSHHHLQTTERYFLYHTNRRMCVYECRKRIGQWRTIWRCVNRAFWGGLDTVNTEFRKNMECSIPETESRTTRGHLLGQITMWS